MCSKSVVNESESKQLRRDFALPLDFKTLFPFERSPFENDPRVSQWVRQIFESSLMSDKQYEKVSATIILSSFFYPRCRSIDRFERICKIMLVLFVIDDHTECEWSDLAGNSVKLNQVWNQMIAVAEKITNKNTFISMNGWKPYVVDLFEVLGEVYEQLSSVSGKRLLEYYKIYAESQIMERELIECKYEYKDLEDMLKIRRQSIAAYVTFALIEYSENLSLNDEEWNHPLFQRLLILSINIIIYYHDVHSFEKEWLEQNHKYERMINVVALTVTLEGCSPERAMVKIAEEALLMEKEVINVIAELNKQDLSGDMRIFLDSTQYIIGGNFQYGDKCDRYNKLYQ